MQYECSRRSCEDPGLPAGGRAGQDRGRAREAWRLIAIRFPWSLLFPPRWPSWLRNPLVTNAALHVAHSPQCMNRPALTLLVSQATDLQRAFVVMASADVAGEEAGGWLIAFGDFICVAQNSSPWIDFARPSTSAFAIFSASFRSFSAAFRHFITNLNTSSRINSSVGGW